MLDMMASSAICVVRSPPFALASNARVDGLMTFGTVTGRDSRGVISPDRTIGINLLRAVHAATFDSTRS